VSEAQDAGALELLGAGAFGAVVGWLLYFLNRYRSEDVRLADLVTVIGALGGGAILALFPAESELFGAYGIGLFVGFFGYLGLLALLVWGSSSFDRDYFIDGRRKEPASGIVTGGPVAMGPDADDPTVAH
jgi:hypothetical protein